MTDREKLDERGVLERERHPHSRGREHADEGLTADQIAQRDTDDMNCGDLQWDDLEGYSATGLTIEPVGS